MDKKGAEKKDDGEKKLVSKAVLVANVKDLVLAMLVCKTWKELVAGDVDLRSRTAVAAKMARGKGRERSLAMLLLLLQGLLPLTRRMMIGLVGGMVLLEGRLQDGVIEIG